MAGSKSPSDLPEAQKLISDGEDAAFDPTPQSGRKGSAATGGRDDDSMSQGHKTCSILALMKHYDVPETRDEFLKLFYLGNVPEEIPAEEESEFPAKFQLATLIETPTASEKLQ